ncbi:transglutaminase TgpA family protein [Thauera linaloolentis]|uniref:Transglutaminase n=1 Tax=Thauera linaloolentis (strain DSM 12138 / JCM 21573 / CCUG 41526 / CIP 105981 / IAM 15112 / NBRC 102519 / 47Lol) TaxID=1123367 RepID=N6YTL6_THAL4|nr:DUF3488 and transglutaminase-like domain-containing protein [Thauera linaloolentis]ENO85513.1 transglutaminase [Thauera linaloolentis 47Lol = DSM 12138]MCM8564770.1 DUF3488 and transglutaminase-like domain-containing protein [Thauera linaloolentis]
MIAAWLRKRRAARRGAAFGAALGRRQGNWLLGAAALTMAPHAGWLPAWITGLCAMLLVWRGLLLLRGSQAPPQPVLLLLTVAAAIGVRAEFGHFFGKDPGVALLALLLGLKLLEIRAARDIRATVMLCFFLQLAVFFEDQSLPIAALALCASLLALAALVSLADPHGRDREHLRVASLLMVQGLPFMLVLFVLFPRIEGPLWGLPADAFGGRTGLSESMSPGSISALSQSGDIAFRADFADEPPPRRQRYWRGPVLTQFDGRNWRAASHAAEATTPFYTPSGERIDYTLTLEPHDKRWLLALDFPGPANAPLRHTSDFQLLGRRPVQSRIRLDLSAYPDTAVGRSETASNLAAARQLPSGFNPRTLALAAAFAADAESHGQILQRAIAHLRDAGLIYTLRPPLLGRDSVDEFLFDTKRGFCEHFASAFTVLMRAAGVPARVVTGYQGGETNPVDGNLVVRQLDAHAWSEVWLADRGWVRIDPTYLAAPRRIDDGLAAALPAGEALPFTLRARNDWLRGMRLRWEALSNAWNQRVLGYNPDRQRALLSRLGLDDAWALAGALAAGAGMLFLGLFLWANRKQTATDPIDRAWQELSVRLAVRGLARHPWEGPHDYARRVSSAIPELAAVMQAIGEDYARLRYGPHTDEVRLAALKRKIKAIRLP